MTDFSLYDEIINFHRVFDDDGPALPAPRGNGSPQVPWENPIFEYQATHSDHESDAFVKTVEARALYEDVFGNFTVESAPKMQKQGSVSESVRDVVNDTIAGMDNDDLMQKLVAATAPSGLQKRRQEFISQTVEKRSDRLWDICAKATRKLESIGFNTERLNLDGLHRSMKIFVEDAILAA